MNLKQEMMMEEAISSAELAGANVEHECCDGECNHDDCCGKVPENCPLIPSETEKIVCAEVSFPPTLKGHLGIAGYTMKASEVEDWAEEELRNSDAQSITVKIKFSMKTKKYMDSIPEANI